MDFELIAYIEGEFIDKIKELEKRIEKLEVKINEQQNNIEALNRRSQNINEGN